MSNAVFLAEVLKEVGIELCPIVRDESSGDPKSCNDVLPYEVLRVLFSDGGQRLGFDLFGEVISGHYQPPLVPWSSVERSYDVQAPLSEGSRTGERAQVLCWLMEGV